MNSAVCCLLPAACSLWSPISARSSFSNLSCVGAWQPRRPFDEPRPWCHILALSVTMVNSETVLESIQFRSLLRPLGLQHRSLEAQALVWECEGCWNRKSIGSIDRALLSARANDGVHVQ